MSSEPSPGLVDAGFRDAYVEILRDGLAEEWRGFADFFGNPKRLGTLSALLDAHLPPGRLKILNVGCGPFASEIFVGALQGRDIVSFDYTAEFAPFFGRFRQEGRLASTAFLRADAMTVAFRPRSFDAILFNDILYETLLDLDALLERLAPTLKPGGLVYLDVMDARLGPLWRLLGRERTYKRYRLDEVCETLARHGLEIVEKRPAIGAPPGPVRALHLALWRATGLSNAVGMAARKAPR